MITWVPVWAEQPLIIIGAFAVLLFLRWVMTGGPTSEYLKSRSANRKTLEAETFKYRKSFLDRKRDIKKFPPPFANTWYQALRSSELKIGEVKPLQLVGKELVAFRNQDGVVGILDAFCPHLGTHLGHGGTVNKDGHLVCPYHEWEFDTSGKTQHVPYCEKDISSYSAIDNKSYPVCEKHGNIFFWYHVDGEPPRFEIDLHTIHKPADVPTTHVKNSEDLLFEMHMMEPSMNSADWYHFSTTHKNFPGVSQLSVFHELIDVQFYEDGTATMFEEVAASFCGLPKVKYNTMKNQLRFIGPGIVVVLSQLGRKTKYTYICFTPIEPFKTKVTFTTICSPGILWYVASRFLAYTEVETIKQDRIVWEHKSNCKPKRLVQGDGPDFNRHSKWLEQFYTEASYKQQETLDW